MESSFVSVQARPPGCNDSDPRGGILLSSFWVLRPRGNSLAGKVRRDFDIRDGGKHLDNYVPCLFDVMNAYCDEADGIAEVSQGLSAD